MEWDFWDVDASFDLISFCLGTQTILVLDFSFGGMSLYSLLDWFCFNWLMKVKDVRDNLDSKFNSY